MTANLALAAQKLHRAVVARQLFIGQRDELQADTVAAIDHQLNNHVQDVEDEYLRAGGTVSGSAEIVRKASAEADAKLGR